MKAILTSLFVLVIGLCQAQWTTIANDNDADSGGLEGSILDFQHDAVNDLVLFRVSTTNLAAFSTAPAADFSFKLPGGLESGNAAGAHWSSTTPVDKTAFIYCDAGGAAPNTYTYVAWAQRIEETASTNVLCNNCVDINVDVPSNQITYTFNRTDILTEVERGGATTVTIGLVANIGNNVGWDDAITHPVNGASNTEFVLNFPAPTPCDDFTATITSMNETCAGDDGQISINAMNGTGPYEYSSDGGATWQTSQSFENLVGRVYEIQVRDDAACIFAESVSLIREEIPMNVLSVDAALCGANNGSLVVGVLSTDLFTYSVNGGAGQSDGMFNDLIAGTYIVRATSDNGCLGTTTVEIENDNDLDVQIDRIKPVDCYYFDNGEIDFHLGGGKAPFSFRLDVENTTTDTPHFKDLAIGPHTIHIADARGCEDVISFNIIRSTNSVSDDCPCTVYAPTAITPDQDGLNDLFKVIPSCPVKDFNMKIFNRGGNLVFETNDVNKAWNASADNEYYLGTEMFIFQISYAWGEGNGLSDVIEESGTVMLVR